MTSSAPRYINPAPRAHKALGRDTRQVLRPRAVREVLPEFCTVLVSRASGPGWSQPSHRKCDFFTQHVYGPPANLWKTTSSNARTPAWLANLRRVRRRVGPQACIAARLLFSAAEFSRLDDGVTRPHRPSPVQRWPTPPEGEPSTAWRRVARAPSKFPRAGRLGDVGRAPCGRA